ncbi:MAG: hypothetical protein GDA40_11235 [Rhodobacteraceae bacterium]|nr:hypothetical protein [Paracoccaceae bacterium]
MLRQYLDRYFNTVVPNSRTDQLNITLVDGFCGGGAYQGSHATEYGSPIILLNAIEKAEERLNQGRAKSSALAHRSR